MFHKFTIYQFMRGFEGALDRSYISSIFVWFSHILIFILYIANNLSSKGNQFFWLKSFPNCVTGGCKFVLQSMIDYVDFRGNSLKKQSTYCRISAANLISSIHIYFTFKRRENFLGQRSFANAHQVKGVGYCLWNLNAALRKDKLADKHCLPIDKSSLDVDSQPSLWDICTLYIRLSGIQLRLAFVSFSILCYVSWISGIMSDHKMNTGKMQSKINKTSDIKDFMCAAVPFLKLAISL